MAFNRVALSDDDLTKVAGGDIGFDFHCATNSATITSDEKGMEGVQYETLPNQVVNVFNCINDKSLNYMTDAERIKYMIDNQWIELKQN